MKVKNSPPLFSIPIAILLIIVASGSAGETQPKPGQAKSESIAEQMLRDVRKSLEVNRKTFSYEEWENSGYTPEDLFDNARQLESMGSWEALCTALEKLKGDDLALFEEEIRNHHVTLQCADDLLSRLRDHWRAMRMDLAKERRGDQLQSLTNAFAPTLAHGQLPSIEKHVDAAAGEVLIDGDLKPGEVAITFDDGPHPIQTGKILKILKDAGVRATYFQMGQNSRNYPKLSQQVADEGHLLGSHTLTHPKNLTKMSLTAAESEILSGADAVAAASGVRVPFFRFPYGARTKALQALVKEKQLATFFWNMDSLDWKIRDPKALLKNVLTELDREGKGILLFHDIHEQTTIVLPWLLEELKNRNFTSVVFVPH